MVVPAFVGWIVQTPISKRLDRRWGALSRTGHRAAQIVTSIRAMFKKDSGAKTPVAINELVCDVVSTSLSELKIRQVSLSLQLLDNLPPVQADRVQLQQVLLNLL